MLESLQSLFGLSVLVLLAWGLSECRSRFPWRWVLTALAIQFLLAVLLLKLPWVQSVFGVFTQMVNALLDATLAGTRFVFGYLAGGEMPFANSGVGSHFILAFQALPLILVMSALSALLFYWRILPLVVRGFAWTLQRGLGIGGPLGLGAAANIFVGMVESPLLIRPYLRVMSRADLFALMVAGMSTLAGTMMAFYASILEPVLPNALGHILTASLISAPAALLVARLMIPVASDSDSQLVAVVESEAVSAMDAITRGTTDGLRLLAHVIAMLLVLVALVSLANQMLAFLPDVAGSPLSLERLLGWLFAPLAWLIGVPWAEATTAGSLLGVKTVLNEMLAYLQMTQLPADSLSERSELLMTYALCGFANLGSLGIMLGGMGAMVPERRAEIVELGGRSILAGTLTTLTTAAVVGVITF